MPQNRFFLDQPFTKDAQIEVTGEEFAHMRVMRPKIGDTFELVNGKNALAQAEVQNLTKTSVELKIRGVQTGKDKPQIILIQALPRMQLLDWIIEKGTELNATEFWLFPGEYSEKKTLSETQISRLKHITISSMKQCGRLDLPKILVFPSLQKIPFSGTVLFGDVRKNAQPFPQKLTQAPFCFCVGPEKGFSEKEVRFLEEKKGVGVHLHENILRTETAAIIGLAYLGFLVSRNFQVG
jgi:16S rRNA (uracil1498-N3)-methyltransferase